DLGPARRDLQGLAASERGEALPAMVHGEGAAEPHRHLVGAYGRGSAVRAEADLRLQGGKRSRRDRHRSEGAGGLAQALRGLHRRGDEPRWHSLGRTSMTFSNGSCGLLLVAAFALACAPSRAETVLNMGVVSRTVFYLPAWMAEKKGFFKAEG